MNYPINKLCVDVSFLLNSVSVNIHLLFISASFYVIKISVVIFLLMSDILIEVTFRNIHHGNELYVQTLCQRAITINSQKSRMKQTVNALPRQFTTMETIQKKLDGDWLQ